MKKLLLSLIALCSFTGMLLSQTTSEIKPTYNGYINEGTPTSTLIQNRYDFEVKNASGFSRCGYLEFPLEDISTSATSITFKIYLSGSAMTDFPTTDVLDGAGVSLLVNKINYTFNNTLTWNNRTIPNETNETAVASISMKDALKDTYIEIDITDIAKTLKAAGDNYIRFRLTSQGGASLLRFRQMVMSGSTITSTGAYYPRLIQITSGTTGLHTINTQNTILYPSIAYDQININGNSAQIYDVNGKLLLNKTIKDNILNISSLRNGMYIVKTDRGVSRFFKN